MNAIVDRYDRDAEDYARYWAPVLEPTARRLLHLVDDAVAAEDGRPTILDVGTGTGSLALAATARWPHARVIGTDAAAGMVGVARVRAAEAGLAGPERLAFVQGAADALPLSDAAVDVVVSSFVFQLVPDRLAALREAWRVLRAGGRLAYVTWLDRETREPFLPMEEFDEAVLDLGIEEPEEPPEQHAGDVPSSRAAANQLRRAGFRDVVAREDVLAYDWTPDSYLEYKLAYDERALLSTLDTAGRQRLAADARRRLARLSPADFRWRPPIVFVTGRRRS
ncbi:MAG TPA: methyltransferase domain-containing protein [Candidatus Caenarcaniphilales bacterium]|nr:methyltransferase domain-containing protein [Candidatus Caenarcaniphilales bacterium]